jgi:6-phosphogluconolactonase (cycloisomerase 2 family)
MVWTPDLKQAYVLCEIGSQVAVFDYDAVQGGFVQSTPRQVLSSLALHRPSSGEATKAAEVAVSPDGRWVFAANRGNNSIAVLSAAPTAADPMRLDSIIYGAAWPRDMLVVGSSLLVIERDMDGIGGVSVYDIRQQWEGGGARIILDPPRTLRGVPSPASFALAPLSL